MPTLIPPLPQEVSSLYGKLSQDKQHELVAYLRAMVDQEQMSSSSKPDRNDALERFIGCAAEEVKKPLTIEEMNEIIADSWAGR